VQILINIVKINNIEIKILLQNDTRKILEAAVLIQILLRCR